MLLTLTRASLQRHPVRTLLAVAGVAVSAALLLDMVMLSSGMRESFRTLLDVKGFDLRLTPRGTMPFDTDARIDSGSALAAMLRAHPGVTAVSPVLGAQLHARGDSGDVAAVTLGVEPSVQGDYELRTGHDISADDELVASDAFMEATRARLGDTLTMAAGYDAQLRAYTHQRRLVVVGTAHFLYMPANPRAIAMRIKPLRTMLELHGDPVSVMMVRVASGTSPDSVAAWISARAPRVSATSTTGMLRQVDQRLSYFRQLAFILGAVSLTVGLLLVTTLVTVTVNERLGEIAVMRAIGVARRTVVAQVVLEGVAIMLAGSVLGLGLGLVTAHYLNGILSAFPGLPAAIDFFLFQPRDAWTALGLLAGCGVLAGIFPAWRGASLPLATTLREEAVA